MGQEIETSVYEIMSEIITTALDSCPVEMQSTINDIFQLHKISWGETSEIDPKVFYKNKILEYTQRHCIKAQTRIEVSLAESTAKNKVTGEFNKKVKINR